MFYTVFSTNDSPYMQWQAELLEYSWKRTGQEGELVRLVATNHAENLPVHQHARSVATRCWDTHPDTSDAYPVYNKPASLLEWVFRDRPEGTVLFLDPDCVFRAPVTRRVAPGYPASQAWVDFATGDPGPESPFGLGSGFAFLTDHCLKTDVRIDAVMIPTLIHTSDLRKICARWLELCGVVRDTYRDVHGNRIWEADMYAYLAACAEYGLQHEPASLGICTNWDPASTPDAPIIHYCQPILGKDGVAQFSKHTYKAWTRIHSPVEPMHDYGVDLVSLINDYVGTLPATQRQLSSDDLPKQSAGVMEGRVLDEMLLERPSDGASLWISESGIAIWDLCDGSRSIGEIVSQLSQEYEVAESLLTTDVFATVDRLRAIGMLELE